MCPLSSHSLLGASVIRLCVVCLFDCNEFSTFCCCWILEMVLRWRFCSALPYFWIMAKRHTKTYKSFISTGSIRCMMSKYFSVIHDSSDADFLFYCFFLTQEMEPKQFARKLSFIELFCRHFGFLWNGFKICLDK